MRGKGRVTIQFGCCYNYAVDKHGNPPGIIRDEEVDPMPPLLKSMIKRMVAWHVLPPTCIPNSCIINIYDKDDCIPPHIDHHDFVRPFCTVSFLSECNILFGGELKIMGPGEFSGSTAIPLPVGSVLILNGNGADVAKHCVPAVPSKRISITFRKMDDGKLPYKFLPDPELQNLHPLPYPPRKSTVQQAANQRSPNQQQITPQARVLGKHMHDHQGQEEGEIAGRASSSPFNLGSDDFPPLGSSSVNGRSNKPSRSLRR
ncbi:RNA demethylase ALKBH5 [Cocos nucifera]|nr:RNA demethylase ALKBH5 [Cocos nucifera]